jgi:hypothetical protein
MNDTIDKALTRTQRVHKALGTQKAVTEYEEAQEAFRRNYERLRAERLAREAVMSEEK